MTQYKVGDIIRIEQCDYSFRWYHNKIGQQFTVSHIPLHEDYVIVDSDIGEKGVLIEDVSLVTEGEQMDKEITTYGAVLQLQSLLEYCGDVAIVIKEHSIDVHAFNKTFNCNNATELEKVCKSVNYLSGMEVE